MRIVSLKVQSFNGGYVHDEMGSLMNELQIFNNYQSGAVKHKAVAQDSNMDVTLEATIILSDQEVKYLPAEF